MLGKSVPNFRHGAILVVGQAINHDRRTAWPVTFVANLGIVGAIELAGTALDRTIDIVLRHALRLGLVDRQAQPRIGGYIAATHACRNRDLTDQLCKQLPALLILGALAVLDVRPFTVSCHCYLLCPSKTRRPRV